MMWSDKYLYLGSGTMGLVFRNKESGNVFKYYVFEKDERYGIHVDDLKYSISQTEKLKESPYFPQILSHGETQEYLKSDGYWAENDYEGRSYHDHIEKEKKLSERKKKKRIQKRLQTKSCYFIEMSYAGSLNLESYLKESKEMREDKKNILEILREGKENKENILKDIMIQVLDALSFMHSKQIAHCDVKPANIVLSGGENGKWKVMIIDLDYISEENKLLRDIQDFGYYFVTPMYRAPEIFFRCFEPKFLTCKIDVWSCACLWYEMLYRRPLFNGESLDIISLLGAPDEELNSWPLFPSSEKINGTFNPNDNRKFILEQPFFIQGLQYNPLKRASCEILKSLLSQ